MKIARVFPHKTKATPTDSLSFIGSPPLMAMPEIDEVHISVAFTPDLERAEILAKEWSVLGVPVKVGGPAFDQPGGEFTPGLYLKKGYTVTSRGCPNRCKHCKVPHREGYKLRELQIKNGWNVIDDNLLGCSEQHIKDVFSMLAKQPHKAMFTGGLEAKIIKPWHVEEIRKLKPERLYMAYDEPADFDPLVEAGKLLRAGGITASSHTACCYVLIGYEGDTIEQANKRLIDTIKVGFMPFAMLFMDDEGHTNPFWDDFQREWVRPKIVATKMQQYGIKDSTRQRRSKWEQIAFNQTAL